MELYTIQMSKWRKAKERRIPFVNTTVKNGVRAFAPTWDIVMGVKSGEISEAEYTARYLQLMEESQQKYPQAWEKLLSFETLALACFCKPGNFCHRLLLVEIIEKLCQQRHLPFIYKGEIK